MEEEEEEEKNKMRQKRLGTMGVLSEFVTLAGQQLACLGELAQLCSSEEGLMPEPGLNLAGDCPPPALGYEVEAAGMQTSWQHQVVEV